MALLFLASSLISQYLLEEAAHHCLGISANEVLGVYSQRSKQILQSVCYAKYVAGIIPLDTLDFF